MPVETGGLEYPINVRDGFSAAFGRFKRGSDEARESYVALKREMESGDRSTGKGTSRRSEAARERRERAALAREAKRFQREIESSNRSLLGIANAQRLATRQLTSEERKRNTEYARALLLQKEGFALTRAQISSVTAQARAERQITKILNRRRQAEAALQAIRERGLSSDLELKNKLGVLTAQERTILRVQRARVRAAEDLRFAQEIQSDQAIAQSRGQLAALRLIQREQERIARDTALREAGRADLIPGGKKVPEQTPQTLNFFQRLNRVLAATDNQTNRTSFTFRRLFGILAAFTIARRIIQGFNELLRTIITSNASIEQSTIGIASVLSAVGEVTDEYGNAVRGVEALNVAQRIATDQVRKLRIDALQTTATFEELAEAFQVGLGPGLASGLNIDQVRTFTRQISQAAQAIGLEQRQLAEEIRSILSGTINVRQTRIAAVLGITNDEIRRAREAGKLFEFLQGEFSAFDVAGAAAAQMFNGLIARIRDAGRLLLAEGGNSLFADLKTLLAEILDTLIQVDRTTNTISLNPQLLKAVAVLSSGLQIALQNLRDIASNIGGDVFNDIAESLAASFAFGSRLVRAVAAIARGALDALSAVSGIGRLLGTIVKGVDSIFKNIGSQALDNILRTTGVILGITAAIGIVVGAIIPLLRLIRAATIAIVALTGVELRFKLGVLRIEQATLGIKSLIAGKQLIILAAVLAILAATGALSFVLDKIGGAMNGLVDRVTGIKDGIKGAGKEFEEGFGGTIRGVSLALQDTQKRVADLREELTDLRAENLAVIGTISSPGLGGGLGKASDVREELAALRSISSESRRIVKQLTQGIEQARQEQTRFRETFDRINRDDIPQTVEELRKVRAALFSSAERTGEVFTSSFDTASFEGLLRRLTEAGTLPAEEAAARIRGVYNLLLIELNSSLKGASSEAFEGLSGKEAVQGFQNVLDRLEAIKVSFEQIAVSRDEEIGLLREQSILTDQELDKALESIRLNAQRRTNELRITEAIEGRASLLEAEAELERTRGNESVSAALEAEASRTRLRGESAIELQEARAILDVLKDQKNIIQARFKALVSEKERTQEQEDALKTVRDLNVEITNQILLQGRAFDRLVELQKLQEANEAERARRARIEGPEGTLEEQIGLSIQRLVEDVPTRFELLFGTLRDLVSGFSDFLAQSLFDAFDPEKKGSIREKFGQFLRGIAQQVISTLIQLAITAAILNAASGNILGSVIAGFGNQGLANLNSRGFNEGGRIDGDTARNARAHPEHFRRPRGLSSGGRPNRPKGLHPKDTIPIWARKDEFMINVKASAKAGYDALARLNSGAFDPARLRAALDLGPGPKAQAISLAAKGPGYATGGRVRSESNRQSSGPLTTGAPISILLQSQDAVERFLRGGGNALDRVLSERGYVRNA